jgi:hypothetical protein
MQGGSVQIFGNDRIERTKLQHLSEEMRVVSGSMNINRDQMVFVPSKNNKEGQNLSLTHKNSSDKMSIAQSVPDPEGSEKQPRQVMSRVPSNSSYINQVSHTGKNVLKAIQRSNEAAEAAR